MTEGQQRRLHERVTINAELPVRRSFAQRWAAQITDFSTHGCRVELVERLQPEERLFVYFPGLETIVSQARWTNGYSAGVEFKPPLHPSVFAMLDDRLRD